MLDKYQEIIERCKREQEEGLCLMNLQTVQTLFDMKDLIRNLKFNAITENQLNEVNRLQEQLESIIEKLYVPDYQLENV